MLIKHNIKRDWKTLKWYILDTLFAEGEKRGDWNCHYTKDAKFFICSIWNPQISKGKLFVFWRDKTKDNQEVSYTYPTEEEAQRVLDYINEFTVQEVVEKPSKDWDNGVTVSYKVEWWKVTITDIKEERKEIIFY